MENREEIIANLACALYKTRAGRDLVDVEYRRCPERAVLLYKNGNSVTVNIAGESGIQMIRDIVRHVDNNAVSARITAMPTNLQGAGRRLYER